MTAKWRKDGKSERDLPRLWNEYVPKHLLPRLHGFELMMAAYAIAHMKIGLKLFETGYYFGSEERVRVFLTNSLESPSDVQTVLEGIAPALAHEAMAVNEVKRWQRFTVVIGNPPYSKLSGNLSPSAVALVEPFRSVRGKRIVEKGALALELNLQDDYVKFWGLLCAQIIASGVGVASYITNSRYLTSPSLRGLRAYISDHFSQAYFTDLGGQVSERKTVEGVDENVFDIEQGVCIGMIVMRPGKGPIQSVLYGRFLGEREEKYRLLDDSSITKLSQMIPITTPLFRFSRGSDDSDDEFTSWPTLDTLMPFNSGSIITSRDNLALDFDREVLLKKVERFAFSRKGDRLVEEEIGYSVKSKWDVERCKAEIRTIKRPEQYVRTILYRPFDRRYIFYLPSLLDTPSKPVCEAIFERENLVLLTPGVKTSDTFTHVIVSREPAEKKACSHDRATQMFPLYTYGGALLSSRLPNLNAKIAPSTDERSIFNYVYAILHCPTYRSRYGNALRDSYPRIPPIMNSNLFVKLSQAGSELVSLHLMESPQVNKHITDFIGARSPAVEKIAFKQNSVWLDKAETTGFKGVSEAIWNFHIGGYQVCEKWLKDRKGQKLRKADIDHYQKIIVALNETIRLMKVIDDVIEQHGGWPDAFSTYPPKTEASLIAAES
jgi:predicted helicase